MISFGIDLGIGSCGWAVIDHPPRNGETGRIVGMGSWIFDVPETNKERTPTNQIRRGNRLLRRVIRRRRNRMAELRRLFAENKLIADADRTVLNQKDHDPWELRARGLDKALEPQAFAVALAHIAKRRGFKSAKKRKDGNNSADDGKMLSEIKRTEERLARYRTFGEMIARDPQYSARRRNREGLYDRTAQRSDLEHEVGALFAAQRRLGAPNASEALEAAYRSIAFRQKQMQDSERLVGACPFEPREKRAAKFSPSFEQFRLLQRLVHLRIVDGDTERPLSLEQIERLTLDLGKTAKLTVKAVRIALRLDDHESFKGIKADQESQDIAARSGEALHGTKKLREALGEIHWAELSAHPESLDEIAHIISFHQTNETINNKIAALALPVGAAEALAVALEGRAFARFTGAGHVSAKAARAMLPHLAQGLRYDQACAAAGYNHAATGLTGREQVTDKAKFNELVRSVGESVTNPIARKAMTEGLKQLWAMRNRFGLPDAIHIELARDVGNSIEERRRIEKRINDTTAQRDRERREAAELLGVDHVDGDTFLRYRLWKEQKGRCVYTDRAIPVPALLATDNSIQVDHILPWSRFGDDSYNNKTLCFAAANQNKRRDTPHEWLARTCGWDDFVARVEGNNEFRGFKKRNYLLKNAAEAEERFRSRNLNDTRYAARLLAEAVKLFYPEGERQDRGGVRRVFTRPGALTAALRQAWGVESLKKVDGKRVSDDRHHALDALVVAAVGEAEVQRLTKSYQEWEQQGLGRPLRYVETPWAGFRQDVLVAFKQTFVARPERRRARGEGHAATVRQVRQSDGKSVVYERKPVDALTASDLERIKDPSRNGPLIAAVEDWIGRGKPMDDLPRSPTGHEIRKIRLETKYKPAVPVRSGTADRGDIVRIDVFARANKKGKDEFYVVPIYPHQVFDRSGWPHPPTRATVAYKDETEWSLIDDSYRFKFSLYPRCYVEVAKANGEILTGYFQGMDRSTGAISLFNHKDAKSHRDENGNSMRGIGAKTLLTIRKYSVDRFGDRGEVRGEVRTWRGEACTLPTPAN